ncbi:hypothetical protein BJ546DRAFT_557571 [Cryomyces antarcticus]
MPTVQSDNPRLSFPIQLNPRKPLRRPTLASHADSPAQSHHIRNALAHRFPSLALPSPLRPLSLFPTPTLHHQRLCTWRGRWGRRWGGGIRHDAPSFSVLSLFLVFSGEEDSGEADVSDSLDQGLGSGARGLVRVGPGVGMLSREQCDVVLAHDIRSVELMVLLELARGGLVAGWTMTSGFDGVLSVGLRYRGSRTRSHRRLRGGSSAGSSSLLDSVPLSPSSIFAPPLRPSSLRVESGVTAPPSPLSDPNLKRDAVILFWQCRTGTGVSQAGGVSVHKLDSASSSRHITNCRRLEAARTCGVWARRWPSKASISARVGTAILKVTMVSETLERYRAWEGCKRRSEALRVVMERQDVVVVVCSGCVTLTWVRGS